MNKQTEQVMEFHQAFDHPINNQVELVDLKTRQLRIKLLFEELKELSEASGTRHTFFKLSREVFNQGLVSIDSDLVDKKEELDALCDIQYVLSGAILALGFQDEFDEAFSEVHSSNMSKMCANQQEVDDTVEHYKNIGTESIVTQKGEKFIVLRKDDNKVLKNKYYREADLSKFIK